MGLDYWIWPGRVVVLGSSLSDPFAHLPARALSARLPDGADPAPGIQGRRAPGAPARERGAAPPDRPGPLPAGPAVARSTVATGPAPAMGRGVHGDPGDAACLAPAAGRPHVGLHQQAPSRSAVYGSRDPEARDRHRDGQSDLGTLPRANSSRLGHPIAASTVWQILRAAGIDPRRAARARPPGSPGALLLRAPLRTAHATHRGTRPKQAAWAVQVVCCNMVFPASRDGCFVRWQVSCTRCVRLLRAALGVSWWTR